MSVDRRGMFTMGFVLAAGLLGLLGACSTPESAALVDAQARPTKERWTSEHFGPLGPLDCSQHEGAGDVKFVDEWVESGHFIDYVDRNGELVRSTVKFNALGTFTDIDSGYQLHYKQAATVLIDYATQTETVTGLWMRLMDPAGRVLAHNVGKWTIGPNGVSGSGQLDVALVCPYFPEG